MVKHLSPISPPKYWNSYNRTPYSKAAYHFDCCTYNFTIHRIESLKKFFNQEIQKYENIRRFTYENDLY